MTCALALYGPRATDIIDAILPLHARDVSRPTSVQRAREQARYQTDLTWAARLIADARVPA